MMPRIRNANAGLTLVEMLVVIIITALTATLVTQGIGQGLSLFRRVSSDQSEIYRELIGLEWLRQSLTTAVANPNDADEFLGESNTLQLRTFRPLLGPEGVQTEIRWSISPNGDLEYREADQTVPVSLGAAAVRIEYQDNLSNWHPRWPIDNTHMLPERVRFMLAGDEMLEVTLLTQRTPFFYADELMYDRD